MNEAWNFVIYRTTIVTVISCIDIPKATKKLEFFEDYWDVIIIHNYFNKKVTQLKNLFRY